jgi:hypothetical protein
VAGGRDLHDRGGDLGHDLAQVHDALVDAAGHRQERVAQLLAVSVDVRAPLVGERVRAPAVLLLRAHQALVLELLERGIDRAGARLPVALGAALDLLDQLVAVLRVLGEQEQEGGADVAPPGPSAAAAPAPRAAAAARTEHELLEHARVEPALAVTSLHKRDPALQAAGSAVMMVVMVVATMCAAPLSSVCCVHVFVSLFFDT